MTSPAELLEQLLAVEARLAVAEADKSRLRAELDRTARERHEADGAVPTFKVRGVGQATLAGVDSYHPAVVDQKAYNEWAVQEHQENVTLVIEVPLSALDGIDDEMIRALHDVLEVPRVQWRHEVHPSLLKWIAENAASPDNSTVIVEGGEVVEGVRMQEAPVRLQVRFDSSAKARAAAALAPVERLDEPEPDWQSHRTYSDRL